MDASFKTGNTHPARDLKFTLVSLSDMLALPPVPAVPREGFMRSVTVWACSCGVRYRAICQTGFIPENKTEVACPRCGSLTLIAGIPQDISEEVAEAIGVACLPGRLQ
jgi:DNA-directed RNA polymerase subunit RPC12/RpoP